jgi:outer membrane immunogenic protein
MKKLMIGAIATLALTTAAFAADLPARTYTKAPAVVAPVYNWTGFYAGVNLGGGWGSSNIGVTPSAQWLASGLASDAATNAILVNNGPDRLRSNGFVGGAQAGYNWQSGMTVFGLEGDLQYNGMKGSAVRCCFLNAVNNDNFQFNEAFKASWLATVRGRVGFLATPDILLYVTGGLAAGDQQFSDSRTAPTTIETYAGSVNTSKVGWTVGAGVEGVISGNWTAKLEYLYVDLGSVSTVGPAIAPVNPLYSVGYQARFTENIVRVGVNYHFASPVVAKY